MLISGSNVHQIYHVSNECLCSFLTYNKFDSGDDPEETTDDSGKGHNRRVLGFFLARRLTKPSRFFLLNINNAFRHIANEHLESHFEKIVL